MNLSIIAPVYNVAGYIEKFIDSIIGQTDPDFELILVDDCGSDNSIFLATNLLSNSEVKYKVISRDKNGGLSAARNSGIREAGGDYLYFADSDDILELNTVEIFRHTVSQCLDGKLFCFNVKYQDIDATTLSTWRAPNSIPLRSNSVDFLSLLYSRKVGAFIWQYLFHKSIFADIVFKEGSVWEDAIFMPQAISAVPIVYSFDSLFIYRYLIRRGSISQSIHPQIDNVIASLDEVETKLYPAKKEAQYSNFVLFRTYLLMTLSRECFVRTRDIDRLIQIHKQWGKSIPDKNLELLWQIGKKKSFIYLYLVKHYPCLIFYFYKFKLLK